MLHLNRKFQILLLAVVVLSTFYPCIHSELSQFDDISTVETFENRPGWKFQDVFLPDVQGGLYYRPIVLSSYIFDRNVHGFTPAILHFENLAVHLFNSILVYLIAAAFLRFYKEDEKRSYFPLTAALLFGLHPLVTESVCWVAGRTDLIAGLFVFLSAYLLLKFMITSKRSYLFLSVFSMVISVLAKETSIMFAPAAALILSARTEYAKKVRFDFKSIFGLLITLLLPIVIFFLLRTFAFQSQGSRIGIGLKFISNDPVYALRIFARALGFYIKKTFLPLPLNFAISDVDPVCELLAIPVILLVLYLLLKRTLASQLFIAGIFLIAPSFLIATNQIAWTAYAERYLYIPLVFILIPTLYFFYKQMVFPNSRVKMSCVIILIILAGSISFSRSLTWQTNYSLVKDTVTKSPENKEVLARFSVILAMRGEYDAAIAYADRSKNVFSFFYDPTPDLVKLYVYDKEGKIDKALNYIELLPEKAATTPAIVDTNIDLLLKKMMLLNKSERLDILMRVEKLTQKIDSLKKEPFLYYRLAKVYLTEGKFEKASKYFELAYNEFADESPYKGFSYKLFNKLQRKRG